MRLAPGNCLGRTAWLPLPGTAIALAEQSARDSLPRDGARPLYLLHRKPRPGRQFPLGPAARPVDVARPPPGRDGSAAPGSLDPLCLSRAGVRGLDSLPLFRRSQARDRRGGHAGATRVPEPVPQPGDGGDEGLPRRSRQRRHVPALEAGLPRAPDQRGIEGAVLSDRAFVLRLFGDGTDRLLLVNLGPDLFFMPAPEPLLAPPRQQDWQMVFSTEDPQYGGSGVAPVRLDTGWRIPAEAATVFASKPRGATDGKADAQDRVGRRM
ncbi:MAG: DUF3459 domain-containing protein [Planctomycetes bacterium]|nr:DUF3459 domain-containing protein [Planctomycetota bacterium]